MTIFKFTFEVSLKASIKKLRGQNAAVNKSEKEGLSKDLEGDSGVNTRDKTESIESSIPTDRYLSRLKSWRRTVNGSLANLLTHLSSLSAQLDRLIKQFATVVTIVVLLVDITGGSLLGCSPEEIMQWLNSLPDANR
ncbi:hypothetical protein WH43_07905 [Rheinheimera sp. KL1]|uniref:hypothetical protein n=1 Tax=Rheinheimera sp. KL1 TaxID=1635005 RepID=UPI0006A9483F|nr:hypothetical protein [Rheinheimera sp. KL1]KOO58748.1 hypothetical protein WH43_07905 [Rheinheimera sp. KL1]